MFPKVASGGYPSRLPSLPWCRGCGREDTVPPVMLAGVELLLLERCLLSQLPVSRAFSEKEQASVRACCVYTCRLSREAGPFSSKREAKQKPKATHLCAVFGTHGPWQVCPFHSNLEGLVMSVLSVLSKDCTWV